MLEWEKMVFSHSVNVETSCRERWLPLAAQWIPNLLTLDALALYLVLYFSLVFACLFVFNCLMCLRLLR